jgi:hypothetical protein
MRDDLIDAVRHEHVPDFRSGIFDVRLQRRDGELVLIGQSTDAAAVEALIERLRAVGDDVADQVVRLPDPGLGSGRHAVIRAAIAPLHAERRLPAPQISQLVMGVRVEVLARERDWVRIRGEDGYIGWMHDGYLESGSEEWAYGWERSTTGESVVSLGAELADEEGRPFGSIPWGGRLVRLGSAYLLPDARRGAIVNGEVVDIDRLADWFPPRGESIVRTARRWLGAPYLWGGVTLNGVDCSGFTQAVMWMHGVALPRDSDLQAATGAQVPLDDDFSALRPGDLLYFAEPGERVSHVAFSLGGSLIIHAALSNGGVDLDDLAGVTPLQHRLRAMLVTARRMLPD